MYKKEILEQIKKVEDGIKAIGAKKDGKGNYSKIYSLDQVQGFIRTHAPELSFRWGQYRIEVINETTVLARIQAIWTYKDEIHIDEITMPGSDINNISFAAGKAITYGKRYYLSGMLVLGSEDLEPDNPEVAKNELVKGILTKFESAPDIEKAVKEGWFNAHKVELDLNVLNLKQLQSIARQIGVK